MSPIAVLVSLYAGIRLFGVWGIIKGPLGFVLIYETYHSLSKMSDRQKTERIASEKRLTKEVRKAIMKGNKFPVVGEGSER